MMERWNLFCELQGGQLNKSRLWWLWGGGVIFRRLASLVPRNTRVWPPRLSMLQLSADRLCFCCCLRPRLHPLNPPLLWSGGAAMLLSTELRRLRTTWPGPWGHCLQHSCVVTSVQWQQCILLLVYLEFVDCSVKRLKPFGSTVSVPPPETLTSQQKRALVWRTSQHQLNPLNIFILLSFKLLFTHFSFPLAV